MTADDVTATLDMFRDAPELAPYRESGWWLMALEHNALCEFHLHFVYGPGLEHLWLAGIHTLPELVSTFRTATDNAQIARAIGSGRACRVPYGEWRTSPTE